MRVNFEIEDEYYFILKNYLGKGNMSKFFRELAVSMCEEANEGVKDISMKLIDNNKKIDSIKGQIEQSKFELEKNIDFLNKLNIERETLLKQRQKLSKSRSKEEIEKDIEYDTLKAHLSKI